ncbi:MAG: hypothetical protein KF746_23795 [Chitinophagaceae bacterium]|nr:hypothetical protein [Chitinophagaceae bacterium]
MLKQFASLSLYLFLFCGKLSAATDSIIFNPAASPVAMRPYFGIAEDGGAVYTPDTLFANPGLFTSIAGFKTEKPGSIFWLFTRIKSPDAADAVISFKHLSYADLYIMPDTPGATATHQRAGAFRPAEQISPGDSRFHFQLRLTGGITYRVLIRSLHTKQYRPVFNFELNDLHRFTKARQQRELVDFWFQGAAMLLLLYVLITWIINRYRSYLWLAVFITGLMLYNLALSRYLIDWFFPSDPYAGWRLTIHFLHLAMTGLYLLVLDFWKVKEKNLWLYRLGKVVLYAIVVLSVLSFFIHYYTGNFRIMSLINGSFLVVQLAYLLRVLLLWKHLDRQERFLGYGVIIYLLIALFVTVALFAVGEAAFSLFIILSGSLLVTISLLFLTGINGKLWQNEKDKTLYLAQLTRLQQQQNQLLEENVAERTQELNRRNKHIELLMNELNHRVKNNMQLLYSLNSLQLSGNKDEYAGNILKDNIARIKAMMLVNDSLNPGNNPDNKTISPVIFIANIVEHSKKMFAQSEPVDIRLSIDNTLILDATAGVCLGLIITELITNSYKHAFSEQPLPQIRIEIQNASDHWKMHYHDNGRGLSIQPPNSFGLTLIADLTRQMKGHYTISRHNGAGYFFTFPNAA